MPLSRSVRLEDSVYEYARTGGRGWAHTSMSGQIGAALDARAYTFDGTMVPVHDSGFKFHWRDPIFNSPSALQSQADAQRGQTLATSSGARKIGQPGRAGTPLAGGFSFRGQAVRGRFGSAQEVFTGNGGDTAL